MTFETRNASEETPVNITLTRPPGGYPTALDRFREPGSPLLAQSSRSTISRSLTKHGYDPAELRLRGGKVRR